MTKEQCYLLHIVSDWACGGQWNRMVTFLAEFVSSLQKANIDLVVFFNGCTEPQRMGEWVASQQKTRIRVNQVKFEFSSSLSVQAVMACFIY